MTTHRRISYFTAFIALSVPLWYMAAGRRPNLEIRDERELIPNTCFSVEPGIYMPEFGVRSEVNVLVRARVRLRSLAGFKPSWWLSNTESDRDRERDSVGRR